MSCANCDCKNCREARKRKRCGSCSKLFVPHHKNRARYCSDACRMVAYRKRKRYGVSEEALARQPEKAFPERPLRGRPLETRLP